MTDREKAIVMAYTGKCMLTKNKFQIFHKYVEDIIGRPIMTHEMAFLADVIKKNSKADFLALCADESNSENPSEWIPISERLPEDFQRVLVTVANCNGNKVVRVAEYSNYKGVFRIKENHEEWEVGEKGLLAWRPLPEPYKKESEEAE